VSIGAVKAFLVSIDQGFPVVVSDIVERSLKGQICKVAVLDQLF
jgi:hypothetical protein